MPRIQTVLADQTLTYVLERFVCSTYGLCSQALGTHHKITHQTRATRPAILLSMEPLTAIQRNAASKHRVFRHTKPPSKELGTTSHHPC